MDRNTITGLFLIGLILIGFSFYFQPSEQDIKQLRQQEDSIKAAQSKKADTASIVVQPQPLKKDTSNYSGVFRQNAADSGLVTIENELIRVQIAPKGGKVNSVELKNYKSWDQKPLMLFEGEENTFGLHFFAGNRAVFTGDLNFNVVGKPFHVSGEETNTLILRLAADENRYIDYIYTLKGNSYLLGFTIRLNNMQDVLAASTSYLDLSWKIHAINKEKDLKSERANTGVYYHYANDEEVDYLSLTSDENEKLSSPVRWVSFKQHFFSAALIARTAFENAEIGTITDPSSTIVKQLSSTVAIPYERKEDESFVMDFYFGPNHTQTLEKLDLGLEKQISLGWGPLKWINRYAVVPVFNFLDSFNLNYGLIILILTILLKIVLFPLTYKSYVSAAKMRLLKPEMDELKEKHGEDQTRLQQEYLKLYKKAGVNPLGGCIPLLLQMPILFAFFFFFPSSIELRQQSFLWAEDLSTYDSIWTFGKVPIVDFLYGDHVSLFCLLMTASTILYTRMNNQMTGATGQMKWMGYLMPLIFMGILNNVSSGLNYYYFCANMITFGQQYLIRSYVDEDALHRKIQENKKKPASAKKSSFQQKLEEMAKARGYQPPKKKK